MPQTGPSMEYTNHQSSCMHVISIIIFPPKNKYLGVYTYSTSLIFLPSVTSASPGFYDDVVYDVLVWVQAASLIPYRTDGHRDHTETMRY